MRLYIADQTTAGDIAEPECAGAAADEHSTGVQQAVEHGNNLFRDETGITAKEGEAITHRSCVARSDRLPVEFGHASGAANEQLTRCRIVDHAEHNLIRPDVGDRNAPAAQTAEEGLGAVNRIDDPDSRSPVASSYPVSSPR